MIKQSTQKKNVNIELFDYVQEYTYLINFISCKYNRVTLKQMFIRL